MHSTGGRACTYRKRSDDEWLCGLYRGGEGKCSFLCVFTVKLDGFVTVQKSSVANTFFMSNNFSFSFFPHFDTCLPFGAILCKHLVFFVFVFVLLQFHDLFILELIGLARS